LDSNSPIDIKLTETYRSKRAIFLSHFFHQCLSFSQQISQKTHELLLSVLFLSSNSAATNVTIVACVIADNCVPAASIPAIAGVPLLPDIFTVGLLASLASLTLLSFQVLLSSMLLLAILLLLAFLLLMTSLMLTAFLPILATLCYCSWYL
jgi:hypothetical protein